MTKKRLTELRFPKDVVKDVVPAGGAAPALPRLRHGRVDRLAPCAATSATPGQLLDRLHKLTRADCTTRNKRKAAALAAHLRRARGAHRRLAEQEELAKIRPELDGNEIRRSSASPPGPVVGQAYKFLLELRMEQGMIGKEAATEALRAWARDRRDRTRSSTGRSSGSTGGMSGIRTRPCLGGARHVVRRAGGVRLTLGDGRELVDGMSSWWAAIHGYRHPVLDAAVRDAARRG